MQRPEWNNMLVLLERQLGFQGIWNRVAGRELKWSSTHLVGTSEARARLELYTAEGRSHWGLERRWGHALMKDGGYSLLGEDIWDRLVLRDEVPTMFRELLFPQHPHICEGHWCMVWK